MHNEKTQQNNIKQKLFTELKRFYLYTFFLFILFDVFNLYDRLLLRGEGDLDSQLRYGYSLVEALILAKVIMIGEAFEIGNKFKRWPLVVHVIYKTLAFTLLLLVFNILEHCLFGWLAGHSFEEIYQKLIEHNINIILARDLIMMVIFAQFFTMLETSRALGDDKLFALFFKRRTGIL